MRQPTVSSGAGKVLTELKEPEILPECWIVSQGPNSSYFTRNTWTKALGAFIKILPDNHWSLNAWKFASPSPWLHLETLAPRHLSTLSKTELSLLNFFSPILVYRQQIRCTKRISCFSDYGNKNWNKLQKLFHVLFLWPGQLSSKAK